MGHRSMLCPGELLSSIAATLCCKGATTGLITPPDELATNAAISPAAPLPPLSSSCTATLKPPSCVSCSQFSHPPSKSSNQICSFLSGVAQTDCQTFIHRTNLLLINLLHDEPDAQYHLFVDAMHELKQLALQQVIDASIKQPTNDCFEAVLQTLK